MGSCEGDGGGEGLGVGRRMFDIVMKASQKSQWTVQFMTTNPKTYIVTIFSKHGFLYMLFYHQDFLFIFCENIPLTCY